MMVLDMQEAQDLIHHGKTHSDDRAVQAWIDYVTEAQKSGGGGEAGQQQRALWNAHQISLHQGVEAASNYYARESYKNPAEGYLMQVVVSNVDDAALSNQGTDGQFAGASLLRLGVGLTYPDNYPVTADQATGMGFMGGGFNLAAGRWNNNTGIWSTRWDG